MALIVQKYGGSSLGTIDRIRNVARRLLETQREGNKVVAVVSAMSGITDKLIGLAHQVMDTPPERELDMLVSTGEQQSIALLCMAIADMGGKAISFTGAQAGICTYGTHTRGRIESISPTRITSSLDEGFIVVCAGFRLGGGGESGYLPHLYGCGRSVHLRSTSGERCPQDPAVEL